MRNFIDIVTAAEHVLAEAAVPKAAFKLASGLDPADYQITDSMADHASWKAKILANNNGQDVEIGAWDDVGYIWISSKDNSIIPVARADEHHMGGDMIHDLIAEGKFKFNIADYLPIWGGGQNYIYSKKEIPKMLVALTKFLSYGGPDGELRGTSEMRGSSMLSSHFIERAGDTTIQPGHLAPLGQDFIDKHKKLSEIIVAAHQSGKNAPAFTAANAFIAYYSKLSMVSGLWPYFTKEIIAALRKNVADARRNNDLLALEQLFFSFDSPKQKLHVGLKAAQKKKDAGNPEYTYEDMNAFWGDVPLAIDVLGRDI